ERAHSVAKVLQQRVHHSYLRATIGSTRAARREGMKLATTVTPSSATVTNPKTRGSCGDSWNRRGPSQLPAASAITTPITMPAAPSVKPSLTTSLTKSCCCAPSAARTPSSWVRCDRRGLPAGTDEETALLGMPLRLGDVIEQPGVVAQVLVLDVLSDAHHVAARQGVGAHFDALTDRIPPGPERLRHGVAHHDRA